MGCRIHFQCIYLYFNYNRQAEPYIPPWLRHSAISMNEESSFNPDTIRFSVKERLESIIESAEKRLGLFADRSLLKFTDSAIRCRCGNPVCSLTDSDIANVIVGKDKDGKTEILCAECGRVLFSRRKRRKKRYDEGKRRERTSPPIGIDISESGRKQENSSDNADAAKRFLVRLFLGGIGGIVVAYAAYLLILILDARGIINIPSSPAETTEYYDGSGIRPDTYDTGKAAAAIIKERISADFSECAAGYGINEMSDTSAVITSIASDLLINGKISPASLTESYLIDEILARDSIDLRDAQKYKDAIRCMLRKLNRH